MPDAMLPTRLAAGCVVYYHDHDGQIKILLICDQHNNWTLPKGHLEPGEAEPEAAEREVLEETGVRGALGPLIGRIGYGIQKRGRPFRKEVAFYLMRADSPNCTPQIEEGISATAWFTPDQALAIADYASVREVIAEALRLLGID